MLKEEVAELHGEEMLLRSESDAENPLAHFGGGGWPRALFENAFWLRVFWMFQGFRSSMRKWLGPFLIHTHSHTHANTKKYVFKHLKIHVAVIMWMWHAGLLYFLSHWSVDFASASAILQVLVLY